VAGVSIRKYPCGLGGNTGGLHDAISKNDNKMDRYLRIGAKIRLRGNLELGIGNLRLGFVK
jgi:hypothetical protein